MIKNKGLTLIEILVVIAIIGFLASIILVSLSEAKVRAKDSKIKQDIDQLRNITAFIYHESNPTSYAELCNSSDHTLCDKNPAANCPSNNYTAELKKLEDDMNAQNGVNACYANVSAFCVSSSLNTGGHYCTDFTGKVQKTNSACSVAGPCP